MDILAAINAIPFVAVIAAAGAILCIIAFGLLFRPAAISTADPQSPLNLCLKCLDEAHDAASTLEFIADWGPKNTKREFQGYVKRLKQGIPLDVVLDELRKTRPTVETEYLITCLLARTELGKYSPAASEIARFAVRQREQSAADLDFILGGSRRWLIGLAWLGVVGGAMLLIALPVYSDALLNTVIGRCVLITAISVQGIGMLAGGRLISLGNRLEREMTDV